MSGEEGSLRAAELDRARADELEGIARANAREWAKGLSVDEYIERERALAAHPWARAHLETRVLRDGGGAILASFDALAMESTAGGVLTIASVFVAPERRGRDLARQMLALALEEAAASGRFAWALLFSDVGTRYYERLGFAPAPGGRERYEAAAIPGAIAARPAGASALAEVRAARRRAAADFALLPSDGLFDWQLERFRVFARVRGAAWPGALEARLPSGSFAVFAPNFRDRTLETLSLRAAAPEDRAALIDAARAQAFQLGLGAALLGPDGIPMVRPLRPGAPPPRLFAPIERVDWA